MPDPVQVHLDLTQIDIPGAIGRHNSTYQFQLERLRSQMNYAPQYINFTAPGSEGKGRGSRQLQANLNYRVFKTEARLVRQVLEANSFFPTEGHDWNVMWVGSMAKPFQFHRLSEYQRINNFPASNEITRKDRLAYNISIMSELFPSEYSHVIPETYVLPDQYDELLIKQQGSKFHTTWIVKPCASSQGRGIYLVENLSEIPQNFSCVISKYLGDPYLINDLKFDLRLYVLVTSFEPLRIYMYNEGLVRFASEAYSTNGPKQSRFMHLTNYSVNKRN